MVEAEKRFQTEGDSRIHLERITGEKNLAQFGGKYTITFFVDELILHTLVDEVGVKLGDVEIRVVEFNHFYQQNGFVVLADICLQLGRVFEFHKDLRKDSCVPIIMKRRGERKMIWLM